MKINNKILVLAYLDGFANSKRVAEIKTFLEGKGYIISVLNTMYLGKISSLGLWRCFYYFIQLIIIIKNLILNKRHHDYYDIILDMKVRAFLLLKILNKTIFNCIICENIFDSYLFINKLNSTKILDCASPIADELYYTDRLSYSSYLKFNIFLNRIYHNTDYLAFHWNLYTNYVRKNIYNGENIIEINWGCNSKEENLRARYNKNPKIICLGYLAGKWVNLPLLSQLSKVYEIDVYGGPAPDKKWGLNFKGYAPTVDIIKNYQFGLITITKDELRKMSFSSKHLEYLSYGLPVLTPDWRKDPLLEDVSIYYNENNFLDAIKKYSHEKTWQEMSDKCYNQAKKWIWSETLKPLGDIVEQHQLP
jgi:hypothetical protein